MSVNQGATSIKVPLRGVTGANATSREGQSPLMESACEVPFEVRLRRTEPSGPCPEELPGPITDRPEATQGATSGQAAVEYLLATLAFIVVFAAMYGFLQNSLRRLFTAAAKIIARSYY